MSEVKNLYVFAVCIVASMYAASAEVVPFALCDLPAAAQCIIHEVRILPCPEAPSKPCKIKRGKSATIEFDYTTQFNATTAHGQVYSVTDEGDLAFIGMNTDACQHTSCPIAQSTPHTYTYTLNVAKKYPARTFLIKWVLRNPDKDENSTEMCCFTTRVKLVR